MNDQMILAIVGSTIIVYVLWAMKSVRIFE